MTSDIGRIEVEAHRDEAALARQFQRVRTLAQARDADRRMRRLLRFEMRFQEIKHRLRLRHRPEFALVRPWSLFGPHFQDDLQRLARHLAVLAAHPIDIEHCPVARQAGRRDTEVQPAAGEVIEHSNAVRKFSRMMIGQQEAAGAEADVLGLQERLCQQQVRRRVRLPRRGMMLANPGLLIAELIQPS